MVPLSTNEVPVYRLLAASGRLFKYQCLAAATHPFPFLCEDLRVARVVQRFMIPSRADAVPGASPLLTAIQGSSRSRAGW